MEGHWKKKKKKKKKPNWMIQERTITSQIKRKRDVFQETREMWDQCRVQTVHTVISATGAQLFNVSIK
jgi:hypothetical protein